MKAEAVDRLVQIGLYKPAKEKFRRSNIVLKSERVRMGHNVVGILYEIDEQEKADIAEFEKAYNALVYHVIKDYMQDGEIWHTYLYVSEHNERWEIERADLKDGYAHAYINTHNYCSEFGTIQFKENGGGLIRLN